MITYYSGETRYTKFKRWYCFMDFPTIHTNFWDAVIAVPSVMIITQIIKILLRVQKKVCTHDSTYNRIIVLHFYKPQRRLSGWNFYGVVLWLCSNWELCFFKDIDNCLSKGEKVQVCRGKRLIN